MAKPEFPLINGVNYSWASARMIYDGVPFVGITAINYEETDTKENNFGAGRFPTSRGYGSVAATCSISLYKDTLAALQKVAPGGRIQDLPPIDVPVAYVTKSGKFTTDVLKNFEFKQNKVATSQGDTKIVTDIECIISHVEWGQK